MDHFNIDRSNPPPMAPTKAQMTYGLRLCWTAAFHQILPDSETDLDCWSGPPLWHWAPAVLPHCSTSPSLLAAVAKVENDSQADVLALKKQDSIPAKGNQPHPQQYSGSAGSAGPPWPAIRGAWHNLNTIITRCYQPNTHQINRIISNRWYATLTILCNFHYSNNP